MQPAPCSLRQVSAGAGLLGPVRLGDAERVSQSRDAGLQVELGGLGQEGLLAEVVQTEERGAALHLGLDQCGRGDLEGAKGLVDFSSCLLTSFVFSLNIHGFTPNHPFLCS